MKTIAIFLAFICLKASAQYFGDAKECHINVNDNLLPVEYDARVNASFKFSVNGSCSGTLINRYVNNQNGSVTLTVSSGLQFQL